MSVPARVTYRLTGTSPVAVNAPAVAEIARTPQALDGFDCVTIFAVLGGNTGGTMDAYLQASVDGVSWFDWCHFPQLLAGAASTVRMAAAIRPAAQTQLTAVGVNDVPALAANTFLGTDWGLALRLIVVSGTGTTVGAPQTVIVTATRLAQQG